MLDIRASYQGFWKYPDGKILEINAEKWNLYTGGNLTLLAQGSMEYDGNVTYLMNADGSSVGGRACFDENGNLTEPGKVLTFRGSSVNDLPNG